MSAGGKRLFALDQNFPEPILTALQDAVAEADLVPLRTIDARLVKTKMEDWQIIHALHMHAAPWDGMITTDSTILSQSREIAALLQTKLTLVVPTAVGHDPLRATGLVLTHLPHICQNTTRDKPQVWKLAAAQRPHQDPWDFLKRIAKQEKTTAKDLYTLTRIPDVDFAQDPLA